MHNFMKFITTKLYSFIIYAEIFCTPFLRRHLLTDNRNRLFLLQRASLTQKKCQQKCSQQPEIELD